MNNVVLVGRLTKDPELRYIPGSGTAVSNFNIAIDRDYTKKDGTKETDFIPIEVMGKSAEFCANYLAKGRLVAIQGSIRVDNYQNQSGEKRSFTKVAAKNVKALDKNPNQNNNGGEYNNPNQNQGGYQNNYQGYNNNQGGYQNNYQNIGTGNPANFIPTPGFQAIDDDDIPF